ncbi:hypothetical protein BJ165DRAFT_710081 [Panaeolus papilionaceus]|nr:hypothetical protein BJ165DRAFT_710081 [Panaeolus papilionaceus]
MDTSKKVCDFYSKNKSCRNGANCKFLHTDNGPSAQVKYSTPHVASAGLSKHPNSQKPASPKPESSKRGSRNRSTGGRTANNSNKPASGSKNAGNQGANQAKSPKPSTPAPSLAAAIVTPAPKPEPSPAWDAPASVVAPNSNVATQPPVTNGHNVAEWNDQTPRASKRDRTMTIISYPNIPTIGPAISLRSPESDQPVKKTSRICPHFRKGSCWKGDKCPHIHDNNAVAASPAPSTLSELVMSPSVSLNRLNLTPDTDRKGKAPMRGSNSGSSSAYNNSPQPTNNNVAQSQQRSALIGSIQDRTAVRSVPAPSPAPLAAPIPPQTPSFQFKPVNASWNYDSDEEEEAILGVRKTPAPIQASALEDNIMTPSSWTPSHAVSDPAPEEVEMEHETAPASTQSTPLQQSFELEEEAASPAGGSFDVDSPRDEAGPVDDFVDTNLSQNGNGHAIEDAGKEDDPAEGVQVAEQQPGSPVASVTEEEEVNQLGDQPAVEEEEEVEPEDQVAADEEEETRDINDLGTTPGFDWSAEVEENGQFGDDNNETVAVATEDLVQLSATTTLTSLNDENVDIASPEPAAVTSLEGELSAEPQHSWDVNNSNTDESEEGTKLDFGLENIEEGGRLESDTCVPDEHEIDQRDSAELFDETDNEATTQHQQQSRLETPLLKSSKPSPTPPFQSSVVDNPYSPSPSSSSYPSPQSSSSFQHRDPSPDSTPSIPAFSPPPAIADSSVRASPAPPVMPSSTQPVYGQFADPADATAAKVNQLQVANPAPALPPTGSSTSAAVAQPALLQQPYGHVTQQQQQQQLGYPPYQLPQPQPVVQQQQIPQLQPSFGFQPLVSPVVVQPVIQQPIIQQQPMFAPYMQSTPMYSAPLTPYNQSFAQQQHQQQSPHWTQFADPQARSDIPFCKLLAQGNCPSGNACTYRHALTIQEFTLLFHDRQPALYTINQTHPWHQQAQPQVHSAPTAPQVVNYSQSFSHTATQSIAAMNQPQPSAQPVAPAQPPKPSVCIFYPLNRCSNGDNCPYLHVQSDQQLSSTNSKSSWGKSGNSSSRSRVPCKFYFSPNRSCDNSQCSFSHDQADAPARSNAPDVQEEAETEKPQEPAQEDDGWGKPTDWTSSGWGPASAAQNNPADAEAWDTPPNTQPVSSSSSTNNVDNNDRSSKPEYVNGKKRCLHFQRGSCWKGDNCKFAHDGEVNGGDSNAAASGSPQQGGSAGTPRSQTSSELRKPSVVDFNDANRATNPDNFGQATTLDEGSKEEGACDTLGDGGGVNTREHGVEKVEDAVVEEREVDEKQGATNEETGDWGAWPENGYEEQKQVDEQEEEQETEPLPEHEEIENDYVEEIVDDESVEEEPIVSSQLSKEHCVLTSPQIFQHPEKDYTLWNSVVRFGPDMTPDNVITSAESRTIIISNLPRRVPIPDVRRLVDIHGDVKDISVLEDFAGSTSIQVQFADVAQATRAFVRLNDQTFQERQLGVKLKSRSPVTARMPALRTSVKVNWPLPSVTAFCYYPTISIAKQEAERVDGKEIKGRVVSATFDSPRKNQKDKFAMKINDLPPDITTADLYGICQAKPYVVLSPPSYEGDVTEGVKLLCHECGGMDTFEVFPVASTHKKLTAFATFTSEAAADHAIKRLHNVEQKLMQNKPLQVRAMYYARYRVEDARFKVLEKALQELQELQGQGTCQVHWSTSDGEGVVLRVLAPGDKGSSFQEVSAEVLKLLQGRIVRDEDGKALWHEYFETSSCSKLLNGLSTKFPILIHRNEHSRHLKMIGSPDIQDQVESRIQKTLDAGTRNAMFRRFTVTKPQIGALINGVLEGLQGREEIGTSKLVLDAAGGILTLWGGKNNNVDEIVTAALERLDVQQDADGSKPRLRCQVCGVVPEQPIQLSCRHSYCRNCLIFIIRNTTQTPILCLGKDEYSTRCFSFVPFIMIRELIPSDEKAFLRSCLASYVGRSSDFFFCPTLDCEAIYRTGEPGLMIKCSRCRCDLCPSCRTWSHVGLDCAAVQEHLHSTADSF